MNPGDTPNMTPSEDPVLNAEVENAVAPYRAILPPDMIKILRATIVKAYTDHPTGQRILQHLRQEVRVIKKSTEINIGELSDAGAEAFQPEASGIRRRSGR